MNEQLGRIIDDVHALHSKLVLLIGNGTTSKSALLGSLARSRSADVINVGSALGKHLAALPVKQRALSVPEALRGLSDKHGSNGLVLLDNIELLFDRSLRLDPLDILKQLGRARRVITAWPGQMREGRLIYAEMGHPEHQDYGLDGLVPFEIQ